MDRHYPDIVTIMCCHLGSQTEPFQTPGFLPCGLGAVVGGAGLTLGTVGGGGV